MQTAFEKVGDHLLRMSDGEVGERSMWVTKPVEWSRVNPDLEQVKWGDNTDYTDTSSWGVREGRTFNPDNVWLGYGHAFDESYPAFKYLREKFNKPEIGFQVGLPAPVDMAVDVFGFAESREDPNIAEVYRQATLREIKRVHAVAKDDVVFQIETVVGLVMIAMSPDDQKVTVAAEVAADLHKLIAESPKGSRFGAHLCLGDFHHKAFATMNDATPVVLLSNALAAGFPKGRTLEYIHVPFAAAASPSSMDPSWYEPLTDLDIPADVRFVAGFIHEDVSAEDNQKLLETIEGFARREVDVAASCGLGRRKDTSQAWDAMEKAVRLIEANS